jgi:4-hydroxy-tetrahydrodipicolinate synthase
MLTPFNKSNTIDWQGLDSLIHWYLDGDISGLFAVSGSSEMLALSIEERLSLAQYVIQKVDGKVPVIVSGTFADSLKEQIGLIKLMHELGADFVVCLVNQFAQESDSSETWIKNAEYILEQTDEIPLGLYECPAPYHRFLSVEETKWAADTGRFVWMKETSESIDLFSQKVNAAKGSPLKILNADARFLLESKQAGGAGYTGIATNFYPQLLSWICQHFDDESEMVDELQTFFTEKQSIVNHKYLQNAKVFLKYSDVDMETFSRVSDFEFTQSEVRDLVNLKDEIVKFEDRIK